MYCPIDDILNNTIFGVPKEDAYNWDGIIDDIFQENAKGED